MQNDTLLPSQRQLFPDRRPPDVPSVVDGTIQTSKAAAERVRGTAAASQLGKVWLAIVAAGDSGLTDREIEETTGIPGNSVRPRRGWLAKRQYIRRLYRDGELVTRADYAVWVRVAERELRLREPRASK